MNQMRVLGTQTRASAVSTKLHRVRALYSACTGPVDITRSRISLSSSWTGRTLLGGGSVLGVGGLATVSPTLAIAAFAISGAIAITALIVRGLPPIIRSRSIAKTAEQACKSPQAERALRVLIGTEYPQLKEPTTGFLRLAIGKVPDPTPSSDAKPSSSQEIEPQEVLTEVPKLAA